MERLRIAGVAAIVLLSSALIAATAQMMPVGSFIQGGAAALPTRLYFEITYTAPPNTGGHANGENALFGIANGVFDVGAANILINNLGTQPNVYNSGFYIGNPTTSDNWGFYPNSPLDIGGTTNSGDTIAFAINTADKFLWVNNVSRGSGWYGSTGPGGGANPATNTNGFYYGDNMDAGPVFILGGTAKQGSSNPNDDGPPWATVTLNAGASAFVGSVPATYVMWNAVGTTTWNSLDNASQTLSNGDLTATGDSNPTRGTTAYFVRGTTSR